MPSSAVWAVGKGGTRLHYNGTKWSAGATAGVDLFGVFGNSANDVWVVGSAGHTSHWDGTGWIIVSTSVTSMLRGVWGSGPNDVWAVGSNGTTLR